MLLFFNVILVITLKTIKPNLKVDKQGGGAVPCPGLVRGGRRLNSLVFIPENYNFRTQFDLISAFFFHTFLAAYALNFLIET